jgi:hypothetical protein
MAESIKKMEEEKVEEVEPKIEAEKAAAVGFWDKLIASYGPDACAAPMDYNRWKTVPFAVSTHLCLGACYAWSIFNEPLSRELGVVAASSQDWLLPQVVTTFTGIIIAQGLGMACLGKWVERVGARIAGMDYI